MFFLNRKRDGIRAGRGAMDSKEVREEQRQQATSKPRLDRRNAVKDIQYQAVGAASWSSSSSVALDEAAVLRTARSLDILPSTYPDQTSFRIDGSVEGEVDMLCRTFGLSGPEGFGISLTDWEARKVRSSSDVSPKSSSLLQSDTPAEKDPSFASLEAVEVPKSAPAVLSSRSMEDKISRQEKVEEDRQPSDTKAPVGGEALKSPWLSPRSEGVDGGIRGVRPPVIAPPAPMVILSPPPCWPVAETPPLILKPPPSMSLPAIDITSSPWDIVRSFAPEVENSGLGAHGRKPVDSEEEEDDEVEFRGLRLGETSEGFTGTSSYSTMNDDDTSSTTTEMMFIISPNGKFKTRIRKWSKGARLGSGSFGTVYEGLSDEGVFFAVKEVSLLDQGANAQQSIIQLEQEIALLSQFEHENIVQYYGTDKEDTKLFIFLELVTQGSLVSLYGKYHLRDSQVSAYTRQILNGLKYLHERNVVHRDIKCANILVHANGSVKLADFGLAKEITKHNLLKSCKGSVYWMAPEVINPTSYGSSADIWSLGCTVLEMLTRQVPYPNMEWTQAFYMIGKGKPPPIPANLSSDARDFISQCVRVNPDDRPTAAQLLDHAFVKRSLRIGSGSDSSHGEDRWSG